MKQQSPQHIAIAGNIGVGKTTLVKRLANYYNWQAQFEAVEHNPYLEDFYEDMSKWAFPLQIFFLHSRFNQVMAIRESNSTIIQDRTIYEDAHIFAKNLRDNQFLSQRDFDNYFSLFQSMSRIITPPDLLIYLRASVPRLQKQIESRGRNYEQSIPADYLESLNENYEDWIGNYEAGRLLVIDIEEVDYANQSHDFHLITDRVDEVLFASPKA